MATTKKPGLFAARTAEICDFHDAHDKATDRPVGNRCTSIATHRIDWEDGRFSYGCNQHLEIDPSSTVKPIAITPLPLPRTT